ncbi:MAG: DUF885 family protein, partial [Planctomycetota bacterium]
LPPVIAGAPPLDKLIEAAAPGDLIIAFATVTNPGQPLAPAPRPALAQAEERLGERFDLAAFHRFLLETGAVPLGMLRERVERWIAGHTRPGDGEH